MLALMGNRDDLLDAAEQCLRDKGFRGPTARDIATAAGTSLAAIGYHFGSKEALLDEALFRAVGRSAERLEQAVTEQLEQGAEGGLGGGRLAAFLRAGLEVFGADPGMLRANLEVFGQLRGSKERQDFYARAVSLARRGFAAGLSGRPDDEIDEHTERTLGMAGHAVFLGFLAQCLLVPDPPTADEITEGLTALAALTGSAPATPGTSGAG